MLALSCSCSSLSYPKFTPVFCCFISFLSFFHSFPSSSTQCRTGRSACGDRSVFVCSSVPFAFIENQFVFLLSNLLPLRLFIHFTVRFTICIRSFVLRHQLVSSSHSYNFLILVFVLHLHVKWLRECTILLCIDPQLTTQFCIRFSNRFRFILFAHRHLPNTHTHTHTQMQEQIHIRPATCIVSYFVLAVPAIRAIHFEPKQRDCECTFIRYDNREHMYLCICALVFVVDVVAVADAPTSSFCSLSILCRVSVCIACVSIDLSI